MVPPQLFTNQSILTGTGAGTGGGTGGGTGAGVGFNQPRTTNACVPCLSDWAPMVCFHQHVPPVHTVATHFGLALQSVQQSAGFEQVVDPRSLPYQLMFACGDVH
jgi:hypothetical protein